MGKLDLLVVNENLVPVFLFEFQGIEKLHAIKLSWLNVATYVFKLNFDKCIIQTGADKMVGHRQAWISEAS